MGQLLNWKDENGIRLREGDTVMLQEPGLDVLGRVEFYADMGRYMLAVTHLRYKACGDKWHPAAMAAKSWRNLAERGHYAFSRRLKGVYLIERVDAARLGVGPELSGAIWHKERGAGPMSQGAPGGFARGDHDELRERGGYAPLPLIQGGTPFGRGWSA